MQQATYAFGYYGGKLSHLSRLLPLLPECHTYVEPFGGSAAVLLNRAPSPVEAYNDLDGGVATFFRVLRDRQRELVRALELTPYGRAEFAGACEGYSGDELEDARRFFVRVAQSRYNLPDPSPGQWSFCVSDSRGDMSSAVSAWLSNIDGLMAVAERLRRVQIENLPALELIARYDTEGTLFYLDPPYLPTTRKDKIAYAHEMTVVDHRDLCDELHRCSARIALSGYEDEIYTTWFSDWYCTKLPARTSAASNTAGTRTARTEVLWTNYDPADVTGQRRLFA